MSLLDSFFNKGFKAAKCKTLLKLTIPRIKLLRNRRELQIKQMRRDIANLLETGQDATARIRVEHIIREENMMAAQEIIELFCELISARLPIIEAQRECPLDLKEAISSVCFAAPRCADLPELLQVQMSFASKYGREFIAAATELMPDCGVNRQLIELLSVRAPSAEKKMNLLKEIAEEHEIDWDPAASETELFKSHEDLLNGPPQFVTGSKVPLPEEKHDESLQAASRIGPDEVADSYTGFDPLEFPEVPKVIVKPSVETNPTLESAVPLPPIPSAPSPESDEVMKYAGNNEYLTHQPPLEPENISQAGRNESPRSSGSANQNKQFVPFISPPSLPTMSFPSGESSSQSPIPLKSKNDPRVDFQDVLAAAQTAAESAERAASAARTAASLAQVRISELTDRKNENESHERSNENPFYLEESSISVSEKPCFEQRNSSGDYEKTNRLSTPEREDDHVLNESNFPNNRSKFPGSEMESKYSPANEVFKEESTHHQPQRASSMDDDSYFSYPNLFTSQKKQTQGNSVRGNSHSTDATS